MPPNTTQLQFSIRGPSFPDNDNLLQAKVAYDSNVNDYTIELDAAAALAEDSAADGNEDTTIYGGYYSVYYIDGLGADGNLALNDVDGYLINYEIMGSPRHLYYERSDGSNLIKLDSASATLTYSSTSGTTEFNFNAQTSNLSYDIPSTSSDRERIGVRFEASNDLERQRGYGGHLGYENISTYKGSSGDFYSFDSETGAVNLKIYFNPNLRSGNHKYRVLVNDRGRGNRSFYTYIYWPELVAMGIVTQDRIAYTNGSGTSDIDGPKIGTVSSQIKDSPPTCTFTPDNAYPNNTSGYVVMTDTKTVLSITDESLASNLANEDYGNEASVYLRYENYDAAGNVIDYLRPVSYTHLTLPTKA